METVNLMCSKSIHVSNRYFNSLKLTLRVFTFTVVSKILVPRPNLPKANPNYPSSNRGNIHQGNIHPPIEGIFIIQSRDYPSSNRGNIHPPIEGIFLEPAVSGPVVWSRWAVFRAVTKKATPFE